MLHECLERVPSNIDAMRELLKYGLRGTDLEALLKIGQGKDRGRFITTREPDESSHDDESLEDVKAAYRKDLLTQIDFEK